MLEFLRSTWKSTIKPKAFCRQYFSVYGNQCNDAYATAKQLCEDLDKIRELAFQWIMSLNLDPSKQTQEVKKCASDYFFLW